METPKNKKKPKTPQNSSGSSKVCSRFQTHNSKPKISLPKPKITPKSTLKSTASGKSKVPSSPKLNIKKELEIANFDMSIDSSDSVAKIENDNHLDANEGCKYPEATVPEVSIPSHIRAEAGPNWRLKEGILGSYYYGNVTLGAVDFAKCEAEVSTADILADSNHTWESKCFHAKLFLANYRQWLRSATQCTVVIRGKRKRQTNVGIPNKNRLVFQ